MGSDELVVGRRQYAGPNGDHREQSEQDRGGSQDGEVRPLTLGLDAEMGRKAQRCENVR